MKDNVLKSKEAVTIFVILTLVSLFMIFLGYCIAGVRDYLNFIFVSLLPLINFIVLTIIYFVQKNIKIIYVSIIIQFVLAALLASDFFTLILIGGNVFFYINVFVIFLLEILSLLLFFFALNNKISKKYSIVLISVLIVISIINYATDIQSLFSSILQYMNNSNYNQVYLSTSISRWTYLYLISFYLMLLFIAININKPETSDISEFQTVEENLTS